MAMRQWLLEAATALMRTRAMSTNQLNSSRTSETTLKDAGVMVPMAVCEVQLAVVLALEHCLAVAALQSPVLADAQSAPSQPEC